MSATATSPDPAAATGHAPATADPSKRSRPPIWPQPIPVIVLTGEKWSGKTIFGLSIAGPDTLIYDTEISSLSYIQDVGATRIDVMKEMSRVFPHGHKPIQRYEWWLNHVRSLTPGRFRVIMCDTVNEIEGGLADWVRTHPQEFGSTAAQYQKMSGIMWGHVKDHWLSIITSELASKCESFVMTTHMGDVWSGDKPTGKRKPKGKDTLFQVSSLYLQVERKKDVAGNLPQFPSALVLKDRVSRMHFDQATGEMAVVPLLPPRIPVATPAAIRRYMTVGVDFTNLKPEERAPEEVITDDDRQATRLAIAEKEAEAEGLRLTRIERQQAATMRQPATPQVVQPQPSANGTSAAPQPPAERKPGTATDIQLATLSKLRSQLFTVTRVTDEAKKKEVWTGILTKRNVTTARDLTIAQAEDLIGSLAKKVDAGDPFAPAIDNPSTAPPRPPLVQGDPFAIIDQQQPLKPATDLYPPAPHAPPK